ncbi:MAG: hypothetical protein WD335_00020 [Candidatus Paceibacterota bacterium]
MTQIETKGDLKITDEEMDAVRKIFNRNFRPFSDNNDHLFRDFGDPKRDIPNALKKLGSVVDVVCQQYGDLTCRALLGYMNASGKQLNDISGILLTLSQIIKQDKEVVVELLSYYRLYKRLADAKKIFESSRISS